MGFWDRLSKIAGAVVDHAEAWKDLSFDIVRAPFTDDEYEGFGNTILGIVQDDVVGGLLGTAIGPEGIGGQAIGAIPEEIRQPVGTFTTEVLGRVDAWQDQWIERPLSAGLLGFNMATQGGLGGFFDVNAYQTAWEIASGTSEIDAELYRNEEGGGRGLSFGRALALATMRVDPRDPRAVDEVAQSSFFNLYSGAWDFAETLFLDPLLVPGKYMQLARGGRLAATMTTDIPQALRRSRRGEMSPTRTLYGRKLGETEIQNFTSSRAQEVINSKNWNNLDAAIEALPISERIREATKNTAEYEDLIGQRAIEIQQMVGRKRIKPEVAVALSQATNSEMRRNHYLYMLGDQNAVKAAQEAASEMAAGLRGDYGIPEYEGFTPLNLFDEIENVESQIVTLRDTIRSGSRSVIGDRRQGLVDPETPLDRNDLFDEIQTWDQNKLKEFFEETLGPEEIERQYWEEGSEIGFLLRGQQEDVWDQQLLDMAREEAYLAFPTDEQVAIERWFGEPIQSTGDPFVDNLRAAAPELEELVALRNDLVNGIDSILAPEGFEQWDFGFVFDIKSRFDANQMNNYATRISGEYGNPIARFLAANDQDTLDLADAAIDQYLADSLSVRRGLIDEAQSRGLLDDLGDEAAARRVREAMRTRQAINRQIYAPLSIRAGNSLSGSATRLIASPARAVKGTRLVRAVDEAVAQRYVNFDDLPRSTAQVQRMIRDYSRIKINGQRLLSADDAAVLEGRFLRLGDAASRRQFFEFTTRDFNKKLARAVFPEKTKDFPEGKTLSEARTALAAALDDRIAGAEKMLATGKPWGGRFGADVLGSKISYIDPDTGETTRLTTPLTTRQLAASKIVPRYDLIYTTLQKLGVEETLGTVGKTLPARGIRAVRNSSVVQRPARLGSDVANAIMNTWRPAVLLRPAWPLRVVGDEVLRVASVVGALGQLKAMRHGFSDYRVELLKRKGIDVEELISKKMREELNIPDEPPLGLPAVYRHVVDDPYHREVIPGFGETPEESVENFFRAMYDPNDASVRYLASAVADVIRDADSLAARRADIEDIAAPPALNEFEEMAARGVLRERRNYDEFEEQAAEILSGEDIPEAWEAQGLEPTPELDSDIPIIETLRSEGVVALTENQFLRLSERLEDVIDARGPDTPILETIGDGVDFPEFIEELQEARRIARLEAGITNPIQLGRINRYSEDDIAQFYVARRGGDVELGYEEYVEDLAALRSTESELIVDRFFQAMRDEAEAAGFGSEEAAEIAVRNAIARELDVEPTQITSQDLERYNLIYDNQRARRFGRNVDDVTAERHADEIQQGIRTPAATIDDLATTDDLREFFGPSSGGGQVVPRGPMLDLPVGATVNDLVNEVADAIDANDIQSVIRLTDQLAENFDDLAAQFFEDEITQIGQHMAPEWMEGVGGPFNEILVDAIENQFGFETFEAAIRQVDPDDFFVYNSFLQEFGDDAATKLVGDLIYDEWGKVARQRGLAARTLLGYGLLGPFGAVSGYALALGSQRRTVQRLAQRTLGERFADDLVMEGRNLLEQAAYIETIQTLDAIPVEDLNDFQSLAQGGAYEGVNAGIFQFSDPQEFIEHMMYRSEEFTSDVSRVYESDMSEYDITIEGGAFPDAREIRRTESLYEILKEQGYADEDIAYFYAAREGIEFGDRDQMSDFDRRMGELDDELEASARRIAGDDREGFEPEPNTLEYEMGGYGPYETTDLDEEIIEYLFDVDENSELITLISDDGVDSLDDNQFNELVDLLRRSADVDPDELVRTRNLEGHRPIINNYGGRIRDDDAARFTQIIENGYANAHARWVEDKSAYNEIAFEKMVEEMGPDLDAAKESLRQAGDLLLTQEKTLRDAIALHYKDAPVTREAEQGLEMLDRAGVMLEKAGRNPSYMGGVMVRNAFGDTKANQEIWRGRVSADRTASRFIEQGTSRVRADIDANTEWVPIVRGEVGERQFARAWERVVNRQWRATGDADLPGNQYLQLVWANTADPRTYKQDLLDFLGTNAGLRVLDDLDVPNIPEAVNALIDAVYDTSNQMLPRLLPTNRTDYEVVDEFVKLREKMASGRGRDLKWESVTEILESVGTERAARLIQRSGMDTTVGQTAGLSPRNMVDGRLKRYAENGFQVLATLPTDNLTRNPYFRHRYQAEVTRRLSAYWDSDEQRYLIEPKQLDRLENEARNQALEDVRYLLYDLTESNRMQEVMSTLMPFLGAWQEVISRWTNIAAENPMYVARVLDNFNSIPVTEDENGNRWMVFRLPQTIGALSEIGPNWPGAGALTKPFVGNKLRFSKDGLSMLAAGGPSFGPMALIPMSEMAIAEPKLYDAVSWAFPYGLPQGVSTSNRALGQLFPAWTKRLIGTFAGNNERERMMLQVAQSKEVRLRQQPSLSGEYPDRFSEILATDKAVFQQEVLEETKALMFARAFASFTMPTSLQVSSPYQMYIENLRTLREQDPANATELFIQQHGDEFWALTSRMTRTRNGVAPTLESMAEFEKAGFAGLVADHPELGGLITGSYGSQTTGAFHEAVYRRQQSESLTPGSQTKMRERVPLEDYMESADVSQGWAKLSDLYDIRDAELDAIGQAGGNSSIRANPQVQQWMQWEISQLAAAHPAWWDAFNLRDKAKDQKLFKGLYAIVENETLRLRPEIDVLVDYLADRKVAVAELMERKNAGRSGSLDARSNNDVAEWWEFTKRQYRDIPEFSAVFTRFLEFDDLDPLTWDLTLKAQI
tara:strand:+ start:780 stop:8978 length:8199 start_codon:yes stop_codon:yes gene_type:complete